MPENSFPKWKENPKIAANWEAFSHFLTCRPITEIQDYLFDSNQGAINVMDSLGVSNLGGFGISASHPALGPASALIHYATENLCAAPANLHKNPRIYCL